MCCPFQDTFSRVDEPSVLIPPWIWPSSKKRNMYNKSQILISYVLAFHVALRVSPHCSSIILKWMSGKGWHIVNLGRLFSFHRYITVMPGYCSNLYCFKQPAKLHSGTWLRARQDLRCCNSESSSLWGDPEDEKQLWMGDSMAQESKSLPVVPEQEQWSSSVLRAVVFLHVR